MITSLLSAPKRVRVSTPALPPKSKTQAFVNVEIKRIIDFGITKRGVIYMRYGTVWGRGCSFISFSKLLKALKQLSQGNVPGLKADVVTYLRSFSQVFPLLAHWNNEQLFADIWHKANNELAAHLESQANRIAGELTRQHC